MFVKNNQEKRYYNGKIDPLTELKEDDVKVEALPFSLPAPTFPVIAGPDRQSLRGTGCPSKSGMTHASRA